MTLFSAPGPRPPALQPTWGFVLGGFLLSAAAGLVGVELGSARGLAAAPFGTAPGDTDGEGLGDLVELVWGTDPLDVNTDNDAYSDLEEVALGGDPSGLDLDLDTSALRVGMVSAADNGFVVTRVAIYVPGGDLSNVEPTVGVVLKVGNGPSSTYVPIEIPEAYYLSNGSLTVYDSTTHPGDQVVIFDLPVPQSVFDSVGWLPVYATVGVTGQAPTSAAVNNILSWAQVPYVVEEPPPSLIQIAGSGKGTIYRPLLPPEGLPPTSTPGQICYQDIVATGQVDGVVQYQIQESECIAADSHCASECPGSTGGTLELYDPLALIGG